MIANFFHLVLGLMGLLLYAGLFLTETEEGRLQNRLEELWIRVDDLQSRAVSRQAAFLQQVSGLIADLTNAMTCTGGPPLPTILVIFPKYRR